MMHEMFDLETTVRRAQTGDRTAFGELVRQFTYRVAAVARRRHRDAHEAEELVQDVFLHAMRKLPQLENPVCFWPWLRRITERVAINRATRWPPLPTAECEVLEVNGGVNGSPLDDLLLAERRQLVRAAVNKLGTLDRTALVAFYLKGKPIATIAAELGVPLGTIKRRLHTARQRLEVVLAKRLDPIGATSIPTPKDIVPGKAKNRPARPKRKRRLTLAVA